MHVLALAVMLATQSIRRVDFANFTYSFDEAPLTLHDGRGVSGNPDLPLTFSKVEVSYGDLTGDGVEEAAVTLRFGGGSIVYVYGIEGGAPKPLGAFGPHYALDAPLKSVAIKDGTLVESLRGGELVWRWDGSRFVNVSGRAQRFSSADCGIAFDPPLHWTATATAECDVELRPDRWSETAKASRWHADDPPLTLILFQRGTSFEYALHAQDFDTFGTTEPYTVGDSSGVVARVFSRVFAKDDDEPRAAGHDIEHVVLKTPGGRVIAFDCPGGTPDDPIDCDRVIRRVVGTLVLQ
jgi:hypothetical protein